MTDLRGMFSFAIWDTRQQSLFLARDRLGKKPLYYTNQGGAFLFASELPALLCDASIPREIDPKALDEYLTYLFVPHPRTIYRGIYKLPPATHATFEPGRPVYRTVLARVRYDRIEQNLTEEDALEELDARLNEAVQMRMLADVPVGAFPQRRSRFDTR